MSKEKAGLIIQLSVAGAVVVFLILSLADVTYIIQRYVWRFVRDDFWTKTLKLVEPLGYLSFFIGFISLALRRHAGKAWVGIIALAVVAAFYATALTIWYYSGEETGWLFQIEPLNWGIPFIGVGAFSCIKITQGESSAGIVASIFWGLLFIALISTGSYDYRSYGCLFCFIAILPGIGLLWFAEKRK